MDDVLAKLFKDYDRGIISRRRLLQTLGVAAVAAPLAAKFGTTAASAQGACRDGYGQGRCPLTKELATAPITPVFASTGWKTVGLDHLKFQVADYKKEAAFYVALMGWKFRSEDGKQAIVDTGDWGSVIFKNAAPGTYPDAPPAAAAGAGRGNRAPVRASVQGFCWAIEPWNAKTVEAELRKRGMTPVADNDGKGFESFHVKDLDGFDLQISNSGGLVKARKTASMTKLSEPAPFEATGWKTIWLDHLSFGVANYKAAASFYANLLGWKESFDEGSQNEMMIGDIGDAIVRGPNVNDPNFGKPAAPRGGRGGGADAPAPAAAPGATTAHIDHISFGIAPWDVDGVRAELEKRNLTVTVDTSSAHLGPDNKMVNDDIHQAAFQSYHTTTPNGYNLQISWMSRDKRLALAYAARAKAVPAMKPGGGR